ncbi:DUF2177 family protein [Uliginosibacterium sp. H1]|uniref:DUF2177 family protein n=1 Tax=Uliginosibacterium sp. H1 TaxID=3114757 RepID=UPI002E189622|nr:DUF2177 family protein [Uliginosibacterium sp. H1]
MTSLRPYMIAFAATAAVFLPLDAAWLGFMGSRLYQPALGLLLAPEPDMLAAACFYPLYLMGVVVFAVRPTVRDEAAAVSALRAAFFGLVAYGTYDLTNQATLQGWPWRLTAIDLVWGSCLTALSAMVARHAVR